jgi:modulator of FtsH protease
LTQWNAFFAGELSAAAALAGLLFVSVSVNQARILSLGRMADRGIEALVMLLLVVVVASLPLIPGQTFRLLGFEVLAVSLAVLVGLTPLQQAYLNQSEAIHRPRSAVMVWTNRVTMSVFVVAGLVLSWRGDDIGVYILPAAILLSFAAVGANAWVLLIEINR